MRGGRAKEMVCAMSELGTAAGDGSWYRTGGRGGSANGTGGVLGRSGNRRRPEVTGERVAGKRTEVWEHGNG